MPTRAIPPRDRTPTGSNFPWHYYQEGFDKPIGAHSKKDLIGAMIKFRIDNQLDIGDPEKDLDAYLESRWPGRYVQSAGREKLSLDDSEQSSPRKRSFLDEVRLTNKLALKKPFKVVNAKTIQERAAICRGCEMNTQIKEASQCVGCIADTTRNAVILSNNKMAKDLGWCSALLHDNRWAVTAPIESLTQSVKRLEDAPAKCWMKL